MELVAPKGLEMSIRRKLFALLVVLALVAAGCGGDDDDADGAAAPEPAAADDADGPAPEPAAGDDAATEGDEGDSDAAATEIVVTEVNFETGVAIIRNDGSAAVDLAGHWLCNRPTYVELSAGALAPGDTREVSLGGFDADGGELGVYSSDNFGSADAMVAYVHWGSGGGRAGVAGDAGLWSGEPVSPAGASITLVGSGGAADSWE